MMVEPMITEPLLKDQFQNLVQQTLEEGNLSKKRQNFSHDDKAVSKRRFKPYTTTRIKSCIFLSNISYAGVSDDDVIDKNFCFDISVLMTKNINPFSLERMLFDQAKHEMIYMLSKDCMPDDFYKFFLKKEIFSYLNSKSVLHPKVSDNVWSFIAEDENNYKKLKENISKNKAFFNMYI